MNEHRDMQHQAGLRTVQSSEAKTHLLRLLDDVEKGETIVITRHGKPIARLVPEETKSRQEKMAEAMAILKSLRGKLPPTSVEEILSMRDEGRKY